MFSPTYPIKMPKSNMSYQSNIIEDIKKTKKKQIKYKNGKIKIESKISTISYFLLFFFFLLLFLILHLF